MLRIETVECLKSLKMRKKPIVVKAARPHRQFLRSRKIAHAVQFAFLAFQQLVPVGPYIMQKIIVSMETIGMIGNLGAADTCKTKRVELDGRNHAIAHASLHMHREVLHTKMPVYLREPQSKCRSILADHRSARDVAAITRIGGIGKFMTEHIEHHSFAVFIEESIDRKFHASKYDSTTNEPSSKALLA